MDGARAGKIALAVRTIQLGLQRVAFLQLFLLEGQQLEVTGRFALFDIQQALLGGDQAILGHDVLRARVQQTIVTRDSPLRGTEKLAGRRRRASDSLRTSCCSYFAVRVGHVEARTPLASNDSERNQLRRRNKAEEERGTVDKRFNHH